MLFMPISSGMTRWSIWPSVSSVFSSLAAALEQRAADLGDLHALAQLEGVVVGDDDLRLVDVAAACRPAPARGRGSSCRGRWAAARAAGRGS